MTTLDATIRESNVLDSIKKYFYDSITTIENTAVSYDKTLSTPKVQGIETDKWVTIVPGDIVIGTLSQMTVSVICCTKKDSEGFKLAQLRDKVMAYLIDTDKTDGRARISLYRSASSGAWTKVGAMVVSVQSETARMEADDNTKFKVITILLQWGGLC